MVVSGLDDEFYMREALSLARGAECLGEVPVGAVVVRGGEIVGRGFNSPIGAADAGRRRVKILVSLARQRLTLFDDAGKALRVYPVSRSIPSRQTRTRRSRPSSAPACHPETRPRPGSGIAWPPSIELSIETTPRKRASV
jgi:hypothetical protein